MKPAGWLIALGIVIVLLSLFADTLGIGTYPRDHFGWKQILGLIVGLALIGLRAPTAPPVGEAGYLGARRTSKRVS